jgi:hypothetical protein
MDLLWTHHPSGEFADEFGELQTGLLLRLGSRLPVAGR